MQNKGSELLINGIGLARGYLNRGSVTASRFIPNSWMSENRIRFGGEKKNVGDYTRVYKTGDLCRYMSDGNLEYLGRIDHQVKIRGFRIELGEIEAVLNQHPSIRECIVIAREGEEQQQAGGVGGSSSGAARLVAYIVTKKDDDVSSLVSSEEGVVSDLSLQTTTSTSSKQLREFVKEKLPEYMIPSAFVILERLPLTPNGKVDRKALPAPDQRPEDFNTYAPPRTIIEEHLVEIWKQILGLQQVGIHDNFFELGGDSIMTIQVVARVTKYMDAKITVKQFFEYPTIAELSVLIEPQKAVISADAESSKYGRLTKGLLPSLAPMQSRMLNFGIKREGKIDYNSMSVIVKLQGLNRTYPSRFERVLQQLISDD